MKYLILLLLCTGYTWSRQTDYCFVEDDNPYLKFALATMYSAADTGRRADGQIPGCSAIQIWMLAKNGIRYPTTDTIHKLRELPILRNQIIDNHEKRKDGHLCNEDLENLRNWIPNVNLTMEMAKKLTPQGSQETKFLARRLQSSFRNLLYADNFNDINEENYVFRSTDSERTRSSMEAFMEGLFNNRHAVRPVPVYGNDTLLKAYSNCPRWMKGEGNDPPVAEELQKFLSGPDFDALIRNVSRRLGFHYALTAEKIHDMYEMCRLDKAWDIQKISSWCAVFNRDELKVLEYAEDLDYYYRAGYGREVNKLIGCAPLQDMMNHFSKIEQGDITGKPKGILYFSHSITILSFLQSLGAAKDDDKLLANNYRNMMNRNWRTSLLAPFSSNVVAVFYRCNSDMRSPYKVMFYLQEKPLKLEGCQVGLCDWNYLKQKYSADQCNEANCFKDSGSAVNQVFLSLVSLLLCVSVFFN